MPKAAWTTPEQHAWLYNLLAGFREAQESKTVPTFLAKVYEDFHNKWPANAPSAKEIEFAKGNEEHAKLLKLKTSEKQIHDWIYNKSHGSSSGSGTRKVLNLKSTSQLLHHWQAFVKLYGEELKPKFNTEWEAHKEANLTKEFTHHDRFTFHNQKMQEWYNSANETTKEKVEEFWQEYKSMDSEGNNPNRMLQK
ncbi:hypothetical protein L208DRAFT_1314754 [Tricholoma matsutake]|nr:hypothetical protein L208DRAFT_1314754 [Tricholoma matsutake 945]